MCVRKTGREKKDRQRRKREVLGLAFWLVVACKSAPGSIYLYYIRLFYWWTDRTNHSWENTLCVCDEWNKEGARAIFTKNNYFTLKSTVYIPPQSTNLLRCGATGKAMPYFPSLYFIHVTWQMTRKALHNENIIGCLWNVIMTRRLPFCMKDKY